MYIGMNLLPTLILPVGLLTANAHGPCICQGSSIKLFLNTSLNPKEGYVSLYRNNTLINQWFAHDNDDNEDIKEETSKKRIFRDGNYDIWLLDFKEMDTGVYKVVYSLKASSHTSRESTRNETLHICIPPDKDCKPSIKLTQPDGYIVYLTASLKETGCGKPSVTVHWLGFNSTNGIIKINSKDDPGSYFACSIGPAMSCLMNNIPHQEYCTVAIIRKYEDVDKENTKSDETNKMNTLYWEITWLVVVISSHLIIRMLCFIYGFYKKYCRKQQARIG